MILSRLKRTLLELFLRRKLQIGNNIFKNEGVAINIKVEIQGQNNCILIGKSSRVENLKVKIRGDNHSLTIGKGVIIKSGAISFEDFSGSIVIDDYTTVEGFNIGLTENHQSITIGKDCMLSHDIEIRNGDSHSIVEHESHKRINPAKPVFIGDHVWVGAHVKVLKGTIIGDNSIIGLGSILTSSYHPNCVIAGVPAKIIKENVTWTRERT